MYLILNRLNERDVLGNDCFEGIPGLAFKDSNGNVQKPAKLYVPTPEELPDIDYSLFDLKRFFGHTVSKGFGKALTYYAGKGCAKRSGIRLSRFYSLDEYDHLVGSMDSCTFCGRNELGLRNFAEDREAAIVRKLHEQYGVTGFFNVQDTVNLKYSTPIGLDGCWFRLFIGTEGITPKNIAVLKQRYGPNLILQAGIESATPEMRRVYGKPVTDSDDVFSKIELMGEEGIQLHASFILGGRGETKDSMKKTSEVARKLSEYDNITWILISPQLILPGSPDYKALLSIPKMSKKYAKEDLIDVVEINRDFLTFFSPGLQREDIVEEIKQTFSDIRENNTEVVLDVKGVIAGEEEYIYS
jgi:radical SAM superfamily enzyme YgiQ (UPF0313 family)